MRKFLTVVALSGFTLSLVVHLVACFGINVSRHVPPVWLLHIGIFVVFLPMVLLTYSDFGTTRGSDFWRRFFAPMPDWAKPVVYGLFAYVVLNFVLFIASSTDGYADVEDGRYVLRSGGKVENDRVVRDLTEDEYDVRNAHVIRGFSGHWLIFYLVPALYFRFSQNRETEEG